MSEETELSTVVQVNDVCEKKDNEIVQESKMLNEELDVSPSKICNNKQITVLQVIDCNKIKVIENSEINKKISHSFNADDIEEEGLENSSKEREDNSIIIKPKKLGIVDSDSEYEGDKVELNIEESQKDKADEDPQSNDSKVYDINNKGELVPEGDSKHKIALTNLCDSESEEEIENRDTNNFDSENLEPIKYKKKSKKKDSEQEPKKMTAKEAAEQRKEIESDSQRRVREKQVSLPYHVPKQRTLQEFMKFRKRFATAVPKEAIHKSASVAIKMTEEQLKIVSRNLKEREKEVEEFFKSESEEEDEEESIETTKDCDKVDEDKVEMELNENSEGKSSDTIDNPTVDITDNPTVDIINNPTVDIIDNPTVDIKDNVAAEIPILKVAEEAMEDKTNDVESNVIQIGDELVKTSSESKEDNLNNSSGSSNSMDLVFNLDDDYDDDDVETLECALANEVRREILHLEGMIAERAKKQKFLKQQIPNIKPCLSGGPNSVIDLDEGITRPDDVSQLMERFTRHACKKTLQKHKIELNITSVSGAGDIQKEKLAVKIEGPDEPEINERPGVRMEKLRNDLQIQMAQKRAEMWKQRVKPPTKDEDMDTYKGERDTCGADDDILDDDEEEELTETEDEEDEEEALAKEAEKDVTKSEFFEEEAEESDPVEESEEDENSDEELPSGEGEKKPLKRIIKPFGEDSDEEVPEEIAENIKAASPAPNDDDSPPAGQAQNNEKTPIRPKIQSKADFGFLTPVNRLTCLQNFDSKLAIVSPGSPALKLQEPSPLRSINWHKKLFIEPESHNTQESIEELATICSGKFVATQTQQEANKTIIESTETAPIVEVVPTTQELMDLCSGQFTGATQKVVDGAPEIESSNMKPATVETITLGVNKEIKNLEDDNEDKFISQLLDEEQMEQFKRKLISPEKSQAANIYLNETDDENEGDDDDIIGQRKKKLKKRRTNAIVDSEDDEDDEDVVNEEECIDLHDEVDDEEIEVEYDSEENEIQVDRTKDEPKKKMKTSDFFENEAELSESEWGSADEDEKGLDQFELELGDKEKFDENKVRNDLEKIHMRRMLDDDNREVKILQEMLLEDGELQGTGRQRQFRWKNIDNQNADENAENVGNDEDGTIDDEDEENEEQWRKKRYEREVFLRNSQNSQGPSKQSDITLNSQVFKLGKKAIIRNQNMSMQAKETDKVKAKQPYSLLNQRGSFLSRGAQVLARVAEYTKVSNPATGGAKNSRNFVFQTVNNDPDEVVKKRKAPAGETPTAIKKIRLENLSPAVGKKDSINSKKKLFGNW